MNVTYKKLWKLLIDKQITAADIRRATELSSCTMSKLRHVSYTHLDVYKRQIMALPEIAEVFQVTVDQLLGLQPLEAEGYQRRGADFGMKII